MINYIQNIGEIDSVYISESFFEVMNEQSCDCDEIVLRCNGKHFALTNHASADIYSIDIRPIEFDKERYPFQVDLPKGVLRFDKTLANDNGTIEGIRFKTDDDFLFVFSLEHNLVLTKSKYDVFEEIEMDVQSEEAVLKIRKTV